MMNLILPAISLIAIGAFLEYLACKVKFLGVALPAATVVGILVFIDSDRKHAEELLASGVMPEGLALAVGMLILGSLFVGMILGGVIYYINRKQGIHRKS